MTEVYPMVVLGGDGRSRVVAELAQNAGERVCLVGFDRQSKECTVPLAGVSALRECRVLILPLPVSTDRYSVSAPYSDVVFPLDVVFSALTPGTLVLGGRCDEAVRSAAEAQGVRLIDYFEREEMMIRNAVPTAEGALMLAMEQTPHTIRGCRCLVLGYGRVAQAVAALFAAVGAKVTVAARRYADFARIESAGYRYTDIRTLDTALQDFELVINTVPAPVLPEARLHALRDGCLVIDLASRPGGVDFEAAKALGVRVIWALSLPGRVAPHTAGAIIWSTVQNILQEEVPAV